MQKKQQYKIAILYICTGKYDIFWKDFFLSAEKFFLPKHHKEYFIFTDKELYAQDTCSRIHKFYQENLGWPFNTLKRFEMFLRIKEQLKNFDFIFFMNANLEFLKEVNEEFLPIEENFTLAQHAGFYYNKPVEFTYDRNPKSTAYIPYDRGKYYVCGGMNGGKTKYYLELIQTLYENTEKDLQNNVIALWHDESHLNHYILDRNDYKLLHPGYCYPQDQDNIPECECFILARNKDRYFDTFKLKGWKRHQESKLKKLVKKLIHKKVRTVIKSLLK